MSDLYNKIESLCKEKDITVGKMCSDTSIRRSVLSDLKNGRKSGLSASTLAKIADYLGTSIDYLLGQSDSTPAPEEDENERVKRILDKIALPAGVPIPIVGTIRAGYPVIAEEFLEGYALYDVDHPEEYFVLRVQGDSMIGAGIEPGSVVLIHQQNYADNGDIVAAVVNGEDATLKRFRQHGRTVMLMPENSDYEPIVLDASEFDSDHGRAHILGVAKKVTRDL